MAGLRQSTSVESKHKLSSTLRNWLPILHSSLSDLGEALAPFIEANPIIEIESGYEEQFEKKIPKKVVSGQVSNSRTEQIEALTIQYKSLYDVLDDYIATSTVLPKHVFKRLMNTFQHMNHRYVFMKCQSGWTSADMLILDRRM